MRSKISIRMSWLASTSLAAKRRTPAPANIALAGENTKPTPSPSVCENAYNTLIVGSSHLCNLSSPLRDCLNWSTCS
ncbi:hypothetical protein EDB83DRAFT_2404664 [Lactarius deliciosus]|nr:hypothetical protein EDB83DRAFT_2404664 [Lactarius deliciosus]